MREKLQRDLRFLRPWIIRLIISSVLGMAVGGAVTSRNNSEEIGLAVTLIAFVLLYFFIAWLYPTE